MARVGFNQFNKNFSTSSGSLNYDGKLKLSSLDALLDWHLFGGATHLTAGIMSNKNKFNLTGTPAANGSYTINGQTFTAAQVGTLNGDVSFNRPHPTWVSAGTAKPKNKGLSFKSDIGVMFQGSPKATLSYTGTQSSAVSSQMAVEQAT